MNIGLVGTGAMTRRLVAAFDSVPSQAEAAGVRFTAAYSPHSGGEFKRDYPETEVYDSYDALLGDPNVEAVYIATPVSTHAELSMRASRAGKHVLCEKPMALSTDECEAMIEAAAASETVLQIGYMMRFHPVHRHIKETIDSGAIGSVRFVHAERTASIDFNDPSFPEKRKWFVDESRSGGGVFWDLGSHLLDLVNYFVGHDVEHGSLITNSDPGYGLDNEATATLRLAGGTMATVYAGWRVPLHDNIVQVYGEKAALFANRSIGPYTDSTLDLITPDGRKRIEIPHENHYVLEFEHFRKCIEAGTEPITSGRNVLSTERMRNTLYDTRTAF